MFSYAVLNDDKQHIVELLLEGKNLTMRVDGGLARSLINLGSKVSLEREACNLSESNFQEVLSITSPTYLGGVPDKVHSFITIFLSRTLQIQSPSGRGGCLGPVAFEEYKQLSWMLR